jgi:hypothetical protein
MRVGLDVRRATARPQLGISRYVRSRADHLELYARLLR